MQKAINFNNVSTVSVKGSDYRIHLWYMSKDVAIKIMNNSNLNENLSEKTYYQKTKKQYQIEQKIIMKMIKKDWESKPDINIENYLKKKKI